MRPSAKNLAALRSPRLWHPLAGKTPKRVSADEAVASIKSNTDIFVHNHAATPTELLDALCRRVDDAGINDIRMSHIILNGPIPWTNEKYWGKIRSNCLFIDGSTRRLVKEGVADYVPVFLSDIPRIMSSGVLPVDTAFITVSPPDERGFCTMGTDIDCSFAAASHAKQIIAVVNPSMPHTYGEGLIHVSHIDYMVDTDRPIYASKGGEEMGEIETKIGQIVAENLVENGATLQLGIGAIPDSTLKAMTGHKDLGVHTELVSDGVLDLIASGVINNQKKTILPGKLVTSFAFGTRRFYDTIHKNPMFHFACCGWTNHVNTIRENHKMTCINSALEVDLTGQVCSDSIGSGFYSGFGGQVDFITASGAAKDGQGKAIIALPSRTSKGRSKIVPTLPVGAGVVTTRAHVHYVVTEYGIADLWGRSVRQRARALIDIAHPDDREELEKTAFQRLKCMPSK